MKLEFYVLVLTRNIINQSEYIKNIIKFFITILFEDIANV